MGMPDLTAEVVSRSIMITDQFEGFHRWKDAPEDVKFLRDYHRHLFGVAVSIRVSHGGRQVEFFQAKRVLATIIGNRFKGKQFDKSCEEVAEALGREMVLNGYHVTSVEVSEDGENSGTVEFSVCQRSSGSGPIYNPGAENWEDRLWAENQEESQSTVPDDSNRDI